MKKNLFRHPSHGLLRWALALFVVIAGLALGLLANRLPSPAPVTAAAADFSAGRAMQHVRAIATRPHPTGSAEIDDTRRYLMARMTALGLEPQIRTQTAISARQYFNDVAPAGLMRNIIGEVKGSDPSLPAILLMAHYDTAVLSPGAGDDTSGVAVALEVARAIKAGQPPRRSVILLFTDGEEAGLLGSSAFFASDPLRHRIGMVVNLEARGDSGKALMFQTSAGNGGLIDLYRRAVSRPAADSLLVTIYKNMPNDTDLTAALDKGLPGMNFAFVGHQMAYHTALSTPDRLNPGSIQHMGDQVLPVIRALADAQSLDPAREDAVFADLFGRYLIAYPAWMGWLLAFVAVGAGWGMTGFGIARRGVDWRDGLAGASGLLALLLGMATLLMLALRLATVLVRDVASPYALVGQFGWLLGATVLLGLGMGAVLLNGAARGRPWMAALVLGVAGLLAGFAGGFSVVPLVLGIAAMLLTLAAMWRPARLEGWFAGALSLLGLLALAMQIMLPNGAHVLMWPLLLLLPSLALLLFAPGRAASPLGLAAMALPALLIAGLMARAGYDFFLMIGITLPAVVTPFILLALLGLVPLIWSSRPLPGTGLLCVAAGLILVVTAGVRAQTPTADSPTMVEAFHIADMDRGSASWASSKLDSTGWVGRVLGQDGGTPKLQSAAPLATDPLWVAPAKAAAFVRPGLELAAVGDNIRLSATNRNGGRFMRLFLKPTVTLTGLRLMDQPIKGVLKAGVWSSIAYHGSGAEPVRLTIPAAGPGRMEVQMVETVDRLPEGSRAIPLPPHAIPFRRAGTSMIVARAAVSW